jgi:hypothetical protein
MIDSRMLLDYQNDLFCFVACHNKAVSTSELAQTYMTFNLKSWLANDIRSRGLFPKIRSGGNLCGVPREQKFSRIRVRR